MRLHNNIRHIQLFLIIGGWSWVVVESKSFDLSIEESEERLQGVIMDKEEGFQLGLSLGSKV